MKILLVHPPPPAGAAPHETGESLGLGYLAAVLRRAGHEIEILDGNVAGLNGAQTAREVLTRDFDCLGITAIHEFKQVVFAIAREVRKRRKDALIAVGGYYATLETEQLFKGCPEIDFAVIGEAETSAPEIFGRIERGEDWRSAPGVAYMRDGELVKNAPPPLVADLDSLPFPERDVLLANPKLGHATIATSRGCYHNCSFCCVGPFYAVSGGRAPRFRSPENVADEIESVIASTGRRKFVFVDDDFIGPGPKCRERAVQIADEIRSRKLGISFTMECRADEVDEEILTILKEVGLSGLLLGIESGVQRQLDTFNKQVTVEQNRKAIDLCERMGLPMRSGLMVFDPYVTMDELQESMKFMRETGLYRQSALETKVILYRGSALAEKVREDGLLIERGLDLDYKFRDPQMGLSYKVTKASASASNFLRGLFGKRRK